MSKKGIAASVKSILGFKQPLETRRLKYAHYLFVISILLTIVCVLALFNAFYHLYNASSCEAEKQGISSQYLLAGYLGMFLTILFSPIPECLLLPVYGHLSLIGIFDPVTTLIVCFAAALFPAMYLAGRFAGRPLLLKGLRVFGITEKQIEVADSWIIEHGKFSIFISTFIPFFYSVASLAAGTLKMNWVSFSLMSIAGFALRFMFLEAAGYFTIYILTATFDYSQRVPLFFTVDSIRPVSRIVYRWCLASISSIESWCLNPIQNRLARFQRARPFLLYNVIL